MGESVECFTVSQTYLESKKMNGDRLNDNERRLWVLNDEGLYHWWKSERKQLAKFIRDNRQELDRCINRALGRGE